MIVQLNFTSEELYVNLIAETYLRGSSPTQTGRGKRLFDQRFKKEEIEEVANIVRRCKTYYKKGSPKEIAVYPEQYALWLRVAQYCMEVA